MLAAVIAVTTAGVLPVFLFGGLAVQVGAELGLSAAAKGQVVFAYFGVAALCSARAGRLTERFGSTLLMRVAALTGVVASLGVASAQSLPWLMGAVGIGGAANAMAQPAANALVVRTIAPGRLGMALAIKQSAIPAATLLAGLAVPSIGLTIGWRWAFVAGAMIALGAMVLVPVLAPHPGSKRRNGSLIDRASMKPLVMLALGVCLGSAMVNSLGAFITSSAVEAGITAGGAGLLLAVGSALGLTLRIGWGAMADRRDTSLLVVVASLLTGGSVGLFAIAVGRPALLVVGTLLAFGSGWSWPGVFNLAIVNHYADVPAAATGITQTGTNVGGACGPLVMGFLVEHFGYGQAWTTFGFVALTAAAVVLVGRAWLAVRPERPQPAEAD